MEPLLIILLLSIIAIGIKRSLDAIFKYNSENKINGTDF